MKFGKFVVCVLLAGLSGGMTWGQSLNEMSAVDESSLCEVLTITNQFSNLGEVLSDLRITNVLPSAEYVYVTNSTVIRLPDGSVLSNSAAEPVVSSTRLSWDLSANVATLSVTNLLLTEVYYHTTNTDEVAEKAYQWFEIYNPAPNPVTMTGWYIKDTAPGVRDDLPEITIGAGEFVVVAGMTNAFLLDHAGYTGQVFQVTDGEIGSGLNHFGDGVELYNAGNVRVDAMSYGSSKVGLSPSLALVDATHSLARDPANEDNNSRNDWVDQMVPDPGTGHVVVGMNGGDSLEITYDVLLPCAVGSGQFFSYAYYEQPPETPVQTNRAAHFLTINKGDLKVTKAPVSQLATVGDSVEWTLTIENVGFGDARHVVIYDSIESGIAFTNLVPTPSSLTASNAVWDETVIPALTNLAPGDLVQITVQGEVQQCSNLANRADAQWGCDEESVCEDTRLNGQTASAGIRISVLLPKLTSTMSVGGLVPIDYCGGTPITVYLTNAPGAATAYDLSVSNIFPNGWSMTGAQVTNGVVSVGDLASGASTNFVVTVEPGGACPLSTVPQPIYFLNDYRDVCGRTFKPPVLAALAQVTNEPRAVITKTIPSFSGDAPSVSVVITLAYEHFDGTEQVAFTDIYPSSTNLTVANITGGGTQSTGRIHWNVTGLSGSGTHTAKFDLVVGDVCGGPSGMFFNQLLADDYVDCRGCTRPVVGNGQFYPVRISGGDACPSGTGDCYFASSKVADETLLEVCRPVTLTHTFSRFGGTNLPPNWAGVTFVSDLASGYGYLSSTNYSVLINGSNVTEYTGLSATNPAMVIDLGGLSASDFPSLSAITGSLVFVWEVSVTNLGQAMDSSSLSGTGCGGGSDLAVWNVGRSTMEITLEPFLTVEQCGIVAGRVDLSQLASPDLVVGSNAVFATYDVKVVMNMDADTNGVSTYDYVTNSTRFTNMIDIGGSVITGKNPTVSGNRLTWELGDLQANGAGTILFNLRAGCEKDVYGQSTARVAYNDACSAGDEPAYTAYAETNTTPPLFEPILDNFIAQETSFLSDTQYVVYLTFLNSGAGAAYNVLPELSFATNIAYGSATIVPSTITATNLLWNLHNATNSLGDLADLDGDGYLNDLPPNGLFVIGVTNSVAACDDREVSLRTRYGCKGEYCGLAYDYAAAYEVSRGSLVSRFVLPNDAELCSVGTIEISVKNSGLTTDYDIQIAAALPAGISLITNSTRYRFNYGNTNSTTDPVIGGLTNTWSSSEIPEFAALDPTNVVTLYFDVYVDCDAANNDLLFTADSSFVDNCGIQRQENPVTSVLSMKEPDITAESAAMVVGGDGFETGILVVNPPEDVLYRIRITNASTAISADAQYVELVDYLPTNVLYKGASVTPDSVSGVTNGARLIWSNATIMAQLGSNLFAQGTAFDIVVTAEVTGCSVDLNNGLEFLYGCDAGTLCQSESEEQTLRTQPVNSMAAEEALDLTACGGTKTVVISNSGARTEWLFLTETAPTGYVFTGASISGEFFGTNLVVDLGNPTGSVVRLDLGDLSSSARDKDDPTGVTNALYLNYGEKINVVFDLASDGSTLDYVADPTDNNFADPGYGNPSQVSSISTTTYKNVCGGGYTNTDLSSTVPLLSNPNIDLQPNSLIVTNGELVTFTATIINQSENGNAGNLHLRLRFGPAWTNLSVTASNIVSSGTSNMVYEVQGSSNVLVDLPGVILAPYRDSVVLTLTANAVEGPGDLLVLAEVTGECANPNVKPSSTFTNIWGEIPLADSMVSSVPGITAPVDGAYYSFDQDSSVFAGFSIDKSVRYDDEASGAAGDTRDARIGEELIYRIEAHYFGAAFSNVTVLESLPANLVFPTSDQFTPAYSGGITNAIYTNGVFTLQPTPITNHASVFTVDIPVAVSNSAANNNGVTFTNAATSAFELARLTNEVPVHSTTINLLEPNLGISKISDKQNVQEGDAVTFSVTITNTGPTNAYGITIYDALPNGMVFNSAVSPASVASVDATHFYITTNEDVALATLIPGGSYTWEYTATVTNQLVGTTLTNGSSVTYVSLDAASTNDQMRTGSGTPLVNDYTNQTTVTITAENLRAAAKSFVSSSQTNTLNVGGTNNLTIGERVVYSIRVDVPQGVVSNLSVLDVVPLGLDWIGSNTSANLTYPGMGYAFTIPSGGPVFPTNTGDGLLINDPDPTPLSSLTSDGSGQPITFTMPSVTNTYDGNTNNDYFVLSMEFVVLNDAVNDGIGPVYRVATNKVVVSDGFTALTNVAPPYAVAEPNLTLAKTITPESVTASNALTVSLVVRNQSTARSEAYQMQLSDLLENTKYDTSTLTMISVPMGWGVSNLAVASGLTHYLVASNGIGLAPGAAITNVFTIKVAQGVEPNKIYTNRVSLFNSSTLYDAPPTNSPERTKTASATDTIRIPGLQLAKVMFATSETNVPPDSTNTFVQIGEVITYQLNVTLPESTMTNLTVLDALPNGLSYIFGSATTDVSTFNGTLPALSESPSGPGALATNGADITFAFNGQTVVSGDGSSTNNTFSIYLDAIVLNTNGNVGLPPNPTILTNLASVTYAGNPSSVVWSAKTTNVVAEPQIALFKSMTPTNIQAGDVISVTFVITNTGMATAYDVELADDLSEIFQSDSATNAVVPTGYVMSVVSDILYFRSDTNAATGTNTLEAGEGLTFTFDVTARTDLQPNVLLTNVVTIHGDSLVSTNVYAIEREYGATNEAALKLQDFQMQKSLYATSETGPADSTNANVQIGEVVTYTLSAVIPAGASTNLQFVDYVPNGMAFAIDSLVVIPGSTNIQLPAATNVTPNVGLMGNNGQDVTITFTGVTLVNNVTNSADRTLTLRLQTMVLDTNINVGIAPQMVLTNIASVTYQGNPSSPAFSSIVTNPVVEPTLLITKSFDVASGDAGDPVVCTLTVTNTGLASAYDLQFDDLVMGGFFDITTISNVTMPDGFTYTVSTGLPNATVTYASDPASMQPTNCIEVAEGLTFRFGMHLAQAVEPGQLLTNGCVVSAADTIDGTNVYDEARDESGARSSDSIVVSNMLVEKVFVTTSQAGPSDTTGTNVTIGETATYRLTATLPESTITNLAIVDIIPAGMSYVNGSVSVNTDSFNGTLPGAPVVTTVGGSGDEVTFTFNGNTVVNEDNDGTNNWFTIELQLLTRDEVGNVGLPGSQTMLPNSATIRYAGNPPTHTSTVVNVIVQEPRLAINKTMFGPSNEMVVVTFAVTNSGLSTAYDLIVTDLFPTNWWDTTTIAASSIPAGFTYTITNAPGDGYVTVMVDTNFLQPTNAVEVGAVVIFEFTAKLLPDLTGTVTNTAVIAQYTTIDGTNPDERFEPLTNDTETLILPGVAITKVRTYPVGRAAAVGEAVAFRITVTNTGNRGLNPLVIADSFDSTYLTYVSAVPTPDSTGVGTISWTNVGPLAIGGTTSLVVNFTALASTEPNDTTNRAVVTPFVTNGLPMPPKTNAATVKIKTVGYTLVKSLSSPTGRSAQMGETVEFEILITNTGETQLVTVPVTDAFESSYLSFLSADPSPNTTNASSLVWTNVGPLAANGQSTNLVVRFTAIQSSTGDDRTNTVSTVPTTSPSDPPVGPKTNTAPYRISNAGYSLLKEVVSPSGRAAAIGEEVVFRMTVQNTGDVTLVSVPMVDTYEMAYLSYISSAPASVDNVNDGTINWTDLAASFGTDLLPGSSFVVTSRFTAVATSTAQARTNHVVTTPTTPAGRPPVPARTNDAPYRISNPGYSLAKALHSPTGRAAQVGESVVFTYTIRNTGDVELITIPVADTYETNYLTYVDSVPASANNVNDGTINWANLTASFGTNLMPGASFVVTSRFTAVATSLSENRTNVVVTTPTTPANQPEVPELTNDAPYQISHPAYTLTKSKVSPASRSAAVGEAVVFNLTIENSGDVELVTAPLADTYETTYLTYVGSVPASDDTVNDGVINWTNVGPIAAGASTTVVVSFTAASSSAAMDRTNMVVATPLTPPDEPGVPPATNDAPYGVSSAGYSLVKALHSPTGRAASVGEAIVFHYTITNTGDVELVTTPSVDTYETNYLTYVSSVPASVDNVNDGTITWTDIGPVPVGASTTVVVNFTAASSSLSAPRTNAVSTSPTTPADRPDVPPASNVAPYRISSPGYTLAKTRIAPTNRPAAIGEAVVFTLTISNTGDVRLVTVPVEDRYETNYLQFISAVPAADNPSNDGVINWANVGPLEVGASTTIVARFNAVTTSDSLNRTNTVTTAPTTPADEPVVVPTTNQAPYAVSHPAFLLTKQKPVPFDRVSQVGETNLFVMTITNSGDVALISVPFVDTYETNHLRYIDSTPPSDDNLNDGVIHWADLTASFSTTLLPGDVFVVTSRFLAVESTLGEPHTNTIVSAPSTPVGQPPVPPQTNTARYGISTSACCIVKTQISPTNRAAAVGETITFDIRICNIGDVDFITTPLIDRYDTNLLQYASAVPPISSNIAGVLYWDDIGTISTNTSKHTTVDFIALQSTTGLMATNLAGTSPTVPTNAPPVEPATNAAPFRISSPGYAITKQLISPTGHVANVGEEIRFAIQITNTGDVELVSVPLTDVYETNYLRYVDSTPSSDDNVNNGFKLWADLVTSFGTNLVPGATFSVTSRYAAAGSSLGANRTNTVWTAPTTPSDEPSVDGKTNDAPYRTILADYQLAKSLISPVGRAANIGEEIVFHVVVTNSGEVELVTVPVEDRYETNYLSFVNAQPAPIDLSDDGTLNWTNVGPLAVGGSTTLVLRFTAATVTDEQTNIVVTAPTVPPGMPEVPVRTNEAPYRIDQSGYTLVKTRLSAYPVYIDQAVEFRIDIANTGLVEMVVLPVTDTYDPIYIQFTNAVPPVNSMVAGTLQWTNLGPLSAGASTSILVQFSALQMTPNDETNTVVTAPVAPSNKPPFEVLTNMAPYSIELRAALGDFVWYDLNADGIQDAGEPGIEGVRVSLYTAGDVLVTNTLTDTNGNYRFSDLIPGDYYIHVDLLTNYVFSPQGQGGDPARDSNVNPTNGNSSIVTLATGETNLNVDAGMYRAMYSLSKTLLSALPVYVDQPVEFRIDIANTGPVAMVELPVWDEYDAAYLLFTNAVPPADASGGGTLQWTNIGPLSAGASTNILVQFLAVQITTHDETNTVIAAPVAPSNEPPFEVLTNTAPYRIDPRGVLGNFVWYDINANGIQEDGEPGIEGVRVSLYTGGDVFVTNSLTDTNGYYLFPDLIPDDYYIHVDLVTNYVFSPQGQGGDPSLDSDVNPTNGNSSIVTLSTGETNLNVDAGMYRANYTLTKTLLSPLPVYVDQPVEFRIRISNPGPVDMVDLPVWDTYDATYLLFTNAVPAADVTGAGTLQWTNVGPLNAGSTLSILVQFNALQRTPSNETNTAITAPVAPTNEPPFEVLTNTAPYRVDSRAALGDYVWYDLNADGIQDTNEPGIAAVRVALYDGSGTFITNTTTDLHGNYLFANLIPDDYYVMVGRPTNYLFSPQGQGGDPEKNSSVNPTSGVSTTITLLTGQTNLTLDAGLYRLGSLAGAVYNDANDNGTQEIGEPSFPNVTLHLYDAATSNLLATTVTDAQGDYFFSGLIPGGYFVGVVSNTLPGDFSLGGQFTDPSAHHTVSAGQHVPDVDFGYLNESPTTAVVGDYVWSDYNNNGLQEPGEPGIGNVQLSLISAGPDGFFNTPDDVTNAVTHTDAAGRYLFTNVAPNEYIVRVHGGPGTAVAGLSGVSGDQSYAEQTSPFTMTAGGSFLEADFGFYGRKGTVGDLVFMDLNANGAFDSGDYGIGNVTVNLLDTNGTVLATTVTAADGSYRFTGLAGGRYVAQITDQNNVLDRLVHTLGTPDVSGQSQPNPYAVNLPSGGTVNTADFGYAPPPGSLGNLVFVDANRDGVFNAAHGDVGLKGVTVNRYDEHTNLVETTVTDANGQYLFTGLDDGTYLLAVDAATINTNLALGPFGPAPGTNHNSQAQPYAITLTNAGNNMTADFGYITDGTLRYGGAIYYDCNGNQKKDIWEQGIPDIEVILYMDLNTNGVVDGNDFAIGHQATDVGGSYLFENLPAAYYVVVFNDPNGVLAGTELTRNRAHSRGASSSVAFQLTQDSLSQNYGYRKKQATGSIGKTCWVDVNRNGLPDEDLAIYGLNNVLLNLYAIQSGTTNFYDSKITRTGPDSQRGHFEFTSLPYGEYVVAVDMDTIPKTLNYPTTPTSFSPILCSNNVFGAIGFGYASEDPTAVELRSFTGRSTSAGVKLDWETGVEQDNLGFYLYRADSLSGIRTQLNAQLIAAAGSDHAYTFTDATAQAGATYSYWLTDVDTVYNVVTNGPVSVTMQHHNALVDYDGDRLADLVVYEPATGTWSIRGSSGILQHIAFGWNAALPVPGDYDGDGKTDLAVYWPAGGQWTIHGSRNGITATRAWGWDAAEPVQADYDGDAVTDVAVYWPEKGCWHILKSSDGQHMLGHWGWSEAQPVPADYDGDGIADVAVYWPDGGLWLISRSSDGVGSQWLWGWNEAQPVPADYDGDGIAEIAVYWPEGGQWIIFNTVSGTSTTFNWGWSAAYPVPDDYDGDGKADIAVYSPEDGSWIILKSSDSSVMTTRWGGGSTRPVQW